MQRGVKQQVPELGPGRGAQTSKGVRRQAIVLKVAATLFAERGYDSVSINEIGVAAGITGPAIYRYFASKEALLVSIYEHLYQRYISGTTTILTSSTEPWDSLEKLAGLQIQLATEEPEKIKIVDRENRHLPVREAEAFRTENRRLLRVWTGVLGKARADLNKEKCEVTVHAVLAMINSITFRRSTAAISAGAQQHLLQMALAMMHA